MILWKKRSTLNASNLLYVIRYQKWKLSNSLTCFSLFPFLPLIDATFFF